MLSKSTAVFALTDSLSAFYSMIQSDINSLLDRSFENNNLMILAAIVVKGGVVNYSTEGVRYVPEEGIVFFENEQKFNVYPIVTDISSDPYITTTHYVRVVSNKRVQVWRTTLDTGLRNQFPTDFSLVIVGQGASDSCSVSVACGNGGYINCSSYSGDCERDPVAGSVTCDGITTYCK